MTTLRDVAKTAGVSYSQASFVLNGRNLHLVSKERQGRIWKAMRESNYRPNRQARQVRQGRTGTLGMLLSAERGKGSTIAPQIAGALKAAQNQNYSLSMLRLGDNEISEGSLPDWIREISLDGMILHYNQGVPDHIRQAICDIRLPVIWLNDRRSSDCVYADEEEAGRLATASLLAQGHRDIIFVSAYSSQDRALLHHSVIDRQCGFEQTMHASGLKPTCLNLEAPYLEHPQVLSLALSRLAVPPTAIIMASRWHAPGVRWVTQSLGLSGLHGQPVDIMTFVPYLSESERAWNRIQVVLIPQKEMGAAAVRQVFSKIENPQQAMDPMAIVPQTVAHWRDSLTQADL